MRLRVTPTALMVGDEILTINANGVITARKSVKRLGLCPSHTKGIQRVHVNSTLCYDDIAPLEIERKSK